MGSVYQPLTPEARQLKQRLSLCIRYAGWIADLEEERRDIAGWGLAEEEAMTKRLQEWRGDWERRRRETAALIARTGSLSSLERRILRLRYLCAAPWDSISAQVHRESGAVYTAYRRALNKLAAGETDRSQAPPDKQSA